MPATPEGYASEFEPTPPRPPKRTQADLDPKVSWGGWSLLSQEIAILRGWEYDPMEGAWWMNAKDKACGTYWVDGLRWADSDEDALHLVDELPAPLFFFERFGTGAKTWRAVFSFRGDGCTWKDCEGRSKSRPEAICKAYISARGHLAKMEGLKR